MRIIPADVSHIDDWVNLTRKLFPEDPYKEVYRTYQGYLSAANIARKEIGFLYQADQRVVAFMNISIRNDYVNGTDTSPVVYIEALYVLPEYRGQGIARKLINRAEEFARERGIKQIASDCLIENIASEAFHKSCGFQEAERVICFVKNVS